MSKSRYTPFEKRTRAARRGTKIDEGLVRRTISGDIEATGCTVDAIEHKFLRGVPDVYVEGGNWIEFKCIPLVSRPGLGLNVTNNFTAQQKRWLARRPSEDRKFAGIAFVDQHMQARFLLVRFLTLYGFEQGHHRWTNRKARANGCDFWSDAERTAYIGQFFGKQYDRCSNWDHPLLRLET